MAIENEHAPLDLLTDAELATLITEAEDAQDRIERLGMLPVSDHRYRQLSKLTSRIRSEMRRRLTLQEVADPIEIANQAHQEIDGGSGFKVVLYLEADDEETLVEKLTTLDDDRLAQVIRNMSMVLKVARTVRRTRAGDTVKDPFGFDSCGDPGCQRRECTRPRAQEPPGYEYETYGGQCTSKKIEPEGDGPATREEDDR